MASRILALLLAPSAAALLLTARSTPMRPMLPGLASPVMTAVPLDPSAEQQSSQPLIAVPPAGVTFLGDAGETYLEQLLAKCPDETMKETWRRAAFWENETATLLEVVNVLGRFDRCSDWTTRTIFEEAGVVAAKEEDERQSLTLERHEMALRMGCGERSALWQNVPNLPFTNEALARSIGLTVEDMQGLPVTRSACNILYDALAESRSTLIPYKVLDKRRAAMLDSEGAFNQGGFRAAWSKSCVLFIVGLFLFGKANFLWILVGVKFLHDWQPDVIPGPKEMGLFKIWGVV